jgi:hypothetical protein
LPPDYISSSIERKTSYVLEYILQNQSPGDGMVDIEDLKSSADYTACGFESRPGHMNIKIPT